MTTITSTVRIMIDMFIKRACLKINCERYKEYYEKKVKGERRYRYRYRYRNNGDINTDIEKITDC